MSWFEDYELIYSYTDREALEDGVLFDLSLYIPAGSPPRDPNFNRGVDRVTASVFFDYATCDKDRKGACLLENEVNPDYDVSEILKIISIIFKRKPDEGMYIGKYEGKTFWIMPNERGNLTLMYPEDY
jgi:hypothetical protein